jgi:hypothetical protein
VKRPTTAATDRERFREAFAEDRVFALSLPAAVLGSS